jgi:hypothetical protein
MEEEEAKKSDTASIRTDSEDENEVMEGDVYAFRNGNIKTEFSILAEYATLEKILYMM